MWTNTDMVVCFLSGIVISIIAFGLLVVQTSKNIKKNVEDEEKNDPANWWKFGGDPYDNNK